MGLIRCFQCMEVFDGEYEVCPHCGYVINSLPAVAYHLYPGTMLNDRYVIGTVLGHGGFGITYNAWDSTLNVRVAIKEYFPNGLVNRIPGTEEVIILSGEKSVQYKMGLDRFLDEARNTVCFSSHPNIVNVYAFFQENNTAYIVMEYLNGQGVNDYIKQWNGKLNVDDAIEITSSLCDALIEIHDHNIIHRDINPNNIFLCDKGVKLIDFGAARISETDTDRTRSIVITPGYAPPEQYQSKSKQGPWTDTYALCATLYRMLTGERPQESIDRMVEDQLVLPHTLNPEIPPWLEAVVMNGVALNSEFRYKSAAALKNALTAQTEQALPEERIRKRKRQRLLTFGGITLAALLVSGGTLAYYLTHQRVQIAAGTTLTVEVPEGQLDLYKGLYEDYFGQAFVEESRNIAIEFTTNAESPSVYAYGTHEDVTAMNLSEFFVGSIDLQRYYLLSDYVKTHDTPTMLPVGYYEVMTYLSKPAMEEKGFAEPKTITADELADDFMKNVPCLDVLADRCPALTAMMQSPKMLTAEAGDEQFALCELDAFVGTNAQFQEIMDVCWDKKDLQTITLNFSIAPMQIDGKAQGYWADAWCVNDELNASEKEAAKLWLQFLLTDGIQESLYVSGEKSMSAIPVNKAAFTEYLSYKTAMSEFLEADVKNMTIYDLQEK